MRTFRFFPALLLAAVIVALAPSLARAAGDAVSVRALLVVGSKQPGKSDGRIAPFEGNLRRIFRFESYRLVGEDEAKISAPGRGSLSLGDGHNLELSAEKGRGESLRVTVSWSQSGRSLMNTGLQLNPGVPAVIGGPSAGENGETYAVILIAK